MGVHSGGQKRAFASPWKLGLRTKIFNKSEGSRLDLITWFNFCNNSLFSGMILTAQQPGSLFWCHAVCSSLCPLLCLQRKVAKLACRLFCSCPSLGNNNMAINLQRFATCYCSRPFAACHCWTQTSWQVMQQGSDCWQRQPTQFYIAWKEA